MQKYEPQSAGQQNDPQSDIVLRQKRFALVLCGNDMIARRLVARLAGMDLGKAGQNLSPSALQFFRFQKLYELWMSEAQRSATNAQIFQSGRENEAIEKGLDPTIAKAMGELPTLHRALLLLIYGENFSYAATAQLLNISIEELMEALTVARHGFAAGQQSTQQSGPRHKQRLSAKGQYEVTYDTAC